MPARAVLFAAGEDFRREHAVDLEELELHRIAARIRRRIDESKRAAEIAIVVAGSFGNEGWRGGHASTI
ncbi:MAG: hypothetical protein WDM81_19660 [Rhizomicrobium sp.]